MRSYRTNSHSKHDLKVHLVWIPKYRKRILTGKVAERVRDVLRQIYVAVSSDNITDEIIQKYIEEQEGEPIEVGQFQIDSTL